jgi:hypothetical protein
MNYDIKFIDDTPQVTLHKGYRLTKRFKLSKTTIAPIRKLLVDGDGNSKMRKNGKDHFIKSYGLNLAPHNFSGVMNTCENATPQCIAACLDDSGMRSVFESIHVGKVAKTILLAKHQSWFIDQLKRELATLVKNQIDDIAIRLNIFSDIAWEEFEFMQDYPSIQFYDYTKNSKRIGDLLPNYFTTFSRSGSNERKCLYHLSKGKNVAVVFANATGKGMRTIELPTTYKGFQVVDGDKTDLRYLDPKGVVVGLRLKTHSIVDYQKVIKTNFTVSV